MTICPICHHAMTWVVCIHCYGSGIDDERDTPEEGDDVYPCPNCDGNGGEYRCFGSHADYDKQVV